MILQYLKLFMAVCVICSSGNIFSQVTRYVDTEGSNFGNCSAVPCATINYAIQQAAAGDIILVDDGLYNENIVVDRNVILKSVNGATYTTIAGNGTIAGLGAIHLLSGRNGVVIGSEGQGFRIIGIDGPAAVEKSAIYLQGAHTNISIEGNEIVANGDAALMGQYNASINGLFINDNIFSGQTFVGDPSGDGFTAQFSLPNVPRQVVVFGGGANTTNTQNITFSNNIISATVGGISTTDNNGNLTTAHEQGNTLVTLDAVGDVIITGNIFSGTTTSAAEALRARGAGNYVITDNIFNGNYNIIFSAATNPITVGEARAQYVYSNNILSGTIDGHKILNCAPTVSIADVYAVPGQAANTIFLGYGVQSLTITATISGNSSYSFEWTDTNGNILSNSTSVTVSPLSTTIYTFTATDLASGCSKTIYFTVYVIDVRDGNKIFICCNGKTNSVPVSAVSAHLDHGDLLGACSSKKVKNIEDLHLAVNIFPNPSEGIFTIDVKDIDVTTLQILDIQGRIIKYLMNSEANPLIEIDISNHPKGLYFLYMMTSEGVETEIISLQ